ncbi:MAG: hypothetical protein J5634_00905 [Bacilli bacterium]|nr:hypothetical protein [Bacilli bacterium]
MKYKIFILIVSVIMLCGCEVVYNLDVDDDFNETIKLIPENDDEANTYKSSFEKNEFYTAHLSDSLDPDEGYPTYIDYYDSLLSDNGLITYNYKFKDNFFDTRAGYKCFPSFRYIEGKYLRINTLADFKCFDEYPSLSKITINIKTSKEVHNHNADSVKDGVYTWTIKKGQDRAINIEIENPDYKKGAPSKKSAQDDNKQNNTSKSENKIKTNYILIAILSGLFFIVLFGIIFFRNKINNM